MRATPTSVASEIDSEADSAEGARSTEVFSDPSPELAPNSPSTVGTVDSVVDFTEVDFTETAGD